LQNCNNGAQEGDKVWVTAGAAAGRYGDHLFREEVRSFKAPVSGDWEEEDKSLGEITGLLEEKKASSSRSKRVAKGAENVAFRK